MKKIFTSLFIFFALLLATGQSSFADTRSIQVLEIFTPDDDRGTCTAFSINQKKGYWVTAAHCVRGDGWVYKISGQPIQILKIDLEKDLALLIGPKVGTLWLRPIGPQVGAVIIVSGYLDGFPYLTTLEGVIADLNKVEEPGVSLWVRNMLFKIALDKTPSMSGSPIFVAGEVVSVNQCWWDLDGELFQCGSVYEDLVEFTEGYWER